MCPPRDRSKPRSPPMPVTGLVAQSPGVQSCNSVGPLLALLVCRCWYAACLPRQMGVYNCLTVQELRREIMKARTFTFCLATAFCLITLVLLSLASSAHAQALFGAVVGNVRDSSDAAIAGAVVTLINS